MEYMTLVGLISQVGFPIAITVFLLFWKKQSDRNHRKEMAQLTQQYQATVAENTKAITHLTTIIKERVK